MQTLLKIIDNTGGFYAKCIGIIGNSKLARPGGEIVVAIKSVILNKKITHRKKRKVLKGTVRRAVLLRTTWPFKRWGNINLKCNSNAAAIVGTWDMPVGNRIYGPVLFEARASKFIRIAMLSEGVL